MKEAEAITTMDELQSVIENGATFFKINVTPDLAKEILLNNPVNRPKKPVLSKLIGDMQDGLWNHQLINTVSFTPKGHLNDGQHRMKAVMATGVAIVVLGTVNASVVGLDEGTPRSLSDLLAMTGVKDSKPVATATKMFYKYFGNGASSNAHLMAFYDTNKRFMEQCLAKAKDILLDVQPARMIMRLGEMAGARAIAIRTFEAQFDAVEIDKFLSLAAHGGIKDDDRHPASRLFKVITSRSEKAISTQKRVELAIQALTQHVTGTKGKLNVNKKAKSVSSAAVTVPPPAARRTRNNRDASAVREGARA